MMKNNQIYSTASAAVTGLLLILTTSQGISEFNISEQCAMASMGYQPAGTTKLAPIDKYALPEPFYAEPVATYKLTQQIKLPSECNTYLAGIYDY